jgi:hypothetical protein
VPESEGLSDMRGFPEACSILSEPLQSGGRVVLVAMMEFKKCGRLQGWHRRSCKAPSWHPALRTCHRPPKVYVTIKGR